MSDCYLGIDIGTSGVKVVAADRRGKIVASATEAFDFDRPRPGWAETPPSRWWAATAAATRRLVESLGRRSIASIGLSGQMHGSVFLDADALKNAGRSPIGALRPALMWNDQRTEPQRAEIENLLGGRRACVEASGCPALCGLTAPKLLWLREHEPDIAARIAGMCLPKDYIALLLTGAFATDVGEGSGTMLFDNEARAWNARTLAALGVDREILPDAVEAGTIIGQVTAWAASQTWLPEGTPLAIGSGDNQAAAIGAGVVDPGEALAIVGTSGVVLAPSETHTPDLAGETPGRLNLFCDATGRGGRAGKWMLSGCMLSAAGSLEWARGVLAPGESFETLLGGAGEIAPGCEGLIFLPYLTGERCPIPDPEARGGWIGLTRSHTRAHLVRAVLEGVAFGLAQIMDIVREACGPAERVLVTGGGAKSAVWRRILADAFGSLVVPFEADEGSALGAAAMGAHGVGAFDDIASLARAWVRLGEPAEPDPAPALLKARAVYDRLYHDLHPASASLAAIDRGEADR
ncbi:MAG: xylulokinase [Phycisphaeraceae bacterium]|nr:MAG: xylulokinase [Phycisphaeraceae bacterium]